MVEQLHSTTVAPVEAIAAGKAVERWNRSISICVPVGEGECGWRKHFDYSTRVVLGFLISLAALDREHEKFCWPGWNSIADNAMKLLERPVGRSQVFAIVSLLVQNGVIVRAKRFRRGAMRKGFIVRDHNDWVDYYPTLCCCGLRSRSHDIRRWEFEAVQNSRKRRRHHVAT